MSQYDERLDAARYYISILNLRAAREILLDYLDDEAEDAKAWYLMAQAAETDDDAIAALERALQLKPEDEDASILLAGIKGDAEMITYPTKPDEAASDAPPKDSNP